MLGNRIFRPARSSGLRIGAVAVNVRIPKYQASMMVVSVAALNSLKKS